MPCHLQVGHKQAWLNLGEPSRDWSKCGSALALLLLPGDRNTVGLAVGAPGRSECSTGGRTRSRGIPRRSGSGHGDWATRSLAPPRALRVRPSSRRPLRLLSFPWGSMTAWRQFTQAMRARGLPLRTIESKREQESSWMILTTKTRDAGDDGAGANREDWATM